MRKSWIVAISVLVILAFTAVSAFAFKMPGIPGKSNLKKEIKSFTLASLDPALKEYEGTDLDPCKDQKFAVAVYGDADFDPMAIALAKMQLAQAFAQKVMADVNAKLPEAKTTDELAALEKHVKAATAAAEAMVTEGVKVVPAATAFGQKLPDKVKQDPIGYGANGKDMTNVCAKIPTIAKELPETVKALGETMKQIVAKKDLLQEEPNAQ